MSLKSSLLGYLILLALAPPLGAGQIPPNEEKKRAAEEVGDRIMQRFHQSLDFESIFKEFFVSNRRLRQREVELVFGRRLNPEVRPKFDEATVERGYAAFWNFWQLTSAYVFAKGKNFNPPAEFERAYKAFTSLDLMEITSAQELDQRFTEKMNHLVSLMRKDISPADFRSETYSRNLAEFKEQEETADVAQMRREFGLEEAQEVYVVKRELFNYFLIEEGGSMKIFTISLRTKHKS